MSQNELTAAMGNLTNKIANLKNIIEQLEIKKNSIKEIDRGVNNKSKGSDVIDNILQKYINYVTYLKDILEIKKEKDTDIIQLQENVFKNLVLLYDNISKYQIKEITDPEVTRLQEKKNKLQSSLKKYLLDMNAVENMKNKYTYDEDNGVFTEPENDAEGSTLLELINNNDNSLIKCDINNEMKNKIREGINTFAQEINLTKREDFRGGVKNVPTIKEADKALFNALNTIQNEIKIFNITDESNENKKVKIGEHNFNLKNILTSYEDGLKKNVEDYIKICKALTELVTTAAAKIDEYNNIIGEQKNIVEEQKEQKRRLTNEIKNIESGNKDLKNRIKYLGLPIDALQIENIFSDNRIALIGDDGNDQKNGLLGEIETKLAEFVNLQPPRPPPRRPPSSPRPPPNQRTNQLTNQDQNIGNNQRRESVFSINPNQEQSPNLNASEFPGVPRTQDQLNNTRDNPAQLGQQEPIPVLTVGGKYKMKKSKKSKSKTSKTTSKKAKSTKKSKTTRTQTKSYNNPKYKNQDGGFVRGGVLFPESFYRSDIVM